MHRNLWSWIMLVGLATLWCAAAHAQTPAQKHKPTQAGQIKVAKVTGTVTAIKPDKTEVPLTTGSAVQQTWRVVTLKNSSVMLVFSNGATIKLESETDLSIDEFLQDPLADNVKIADLQEEPNVSTTKLNLARGELVGDVKHLKREQGSEFSVQTPVGAAGIRGTLFRIVFYPSSDGKAFFSLSTGVGDVHFTGSGQQSSGEVATPGVSVTTGNQVVVTVDVHTDPVTGAITVTAPIQIASTQTMTTDQQVAIASVAQDLATSAASTQFKASSGSGGTGSGGGNTDPQKKDDPPPGDTTKKDDPPADTTKKDQTPPADTFKPATNNYTVAPLPSTTPKDGQNPSG